MELEENQLAGQNFKMNHTGPGVLPMAKAGPNADGHQFYICISMIGCLDGKYVFGKVVDGYGVVKEMEKVGSHGGST